MCFEKPRRIPKYLLLQPEPAVYRRRPKNIAGPTLFLLVVLSLAIAGVAMDVSKTGWFIKQAPPLFPVATQTS